jgi:hypothetical protein
MYYRTMFDREVAKDIVIARFLSQHRTQIDTLHEQVGLTLQAASETADGADASISRQRPAAQVYVENPSQAATIDRQVPGGPGVTDRPVKIHRELFRPTCHRVGDSCPTP